jgi:ketosteroid isomerase-like protein
MSTEQYKLDMRRWMDALNKRDLNLLDTLADELYATDYVLHDPDFPNLPPGPAGVKPMMRKLLTDVIPDMQVTLEDTIVEGNKVAVRFTMRGTDLPTGKPVRLTILSVAHYSGGKVVEEWELVR